ncbi:hypothetical protein, partial [Paramuribaculum intestinale]|uniref:hypothetical protein n=1 Tax=Paramuribaculum intestinale TaxID=2094151 RepID=UPI00272D404E
SAEKRRNRIRRTRKECAARSGALFSSLSEEEGRGIVVGKKEKKEKKGQPLPQFVLSPETGSMREKQHPSQGI